MAAAELSFEILGEQITPERAREVIKKASQVKWGTHLVKWRFDEIVHEGRLYKKRQMLSPDFWHLLKRIHIDHHWDLSATVETLNQTAREVIPAKDKDGTNFLLAQIDSQKINREAWKI